jgi:hypothetical protein
MLWDKTAVSWAFRLQHVVENQSGGELGRVMSWDLL